MSNKRERNGHKAISLLSDPILVKLKQKLCTSAFTSIFEPKACYMNPSLASQITPSQNKPRCKDYKRYLL